MAWRVTGYEGRLGREWVNGGSSARVVDDDDDKDGGGGLGWCAWTSVVECVMLRRRSSFSCSQTVVIATPTLRSTSRAI